MAKVTHKELMGLIKLHIKSGNSLMVRGEPGIGKTDVFRQVAAEEARRLGKNLIVWNALSNTERLEFYNSMEMRRTSYVLSVIDLLSKLPEDISGLPKSGEEYIQWLPDLQFWALSQPEVHGMAFFDELLQAQQAIQKPVAGAFLDKMMGTIKLSRNVSVFAASNRKEDRCGIIEMLEHLKNRMGHVELATPSAKDWCDNWAIPRNIDPRIVSFVMFKPDMMYSHLDNRKSDAFPSPRSWAILSGILQDNNIGSDNTDMLELIAGTRVGEGAGSLFGAFIKLRDRIDCEKLLDHPEGIERLELDLKLAFSSWAVENAGRKGYLNKVLPTLHYLRKEDLAVFVLSMLKSRVGQKDLRTAMERKENEHLFDLRHFME
jgi:hypothetical protein